jgi:hypothetical protein
VTGGISDSERPLTSADLRREFDLLRVFIAELFSGTQAQPGRPPALELVEGGGNGRSKRRAKLRAV